MRLLPIAFATLPLLATAQRFVDRRCPKTYRNADHPHYWKNRPPTEGYWQQDVHYIIDAHYG